MLDQIQEDLQSFSTAGITKDALDDLMKPENNSLFLARVHIKDGIVSIQYPEEHFTQMSFRVEKMAESFRELASFAPLPEVDFIFSTHDDLNNRTTHLEKVAPIFVFAKSQDAPSHLILIPDFESLHGNSKQIRDTFRGNALYPWKTKQPKALWRGAMTGGDFTPETFLSFPRTKAITASLANPHLIDAKFTNLTQCFDCETIRDLYGEYFGQFLSTQQQIAYKYQLLIDGNTCAYSRAFWQLFSNCVIFKQTSKSIQWYYRALKPYEHYVPIAADLSDLEDKIHWARKHDKTVQKISENAQHFAHENLSHPRVLQYLYLLLLEYSKLQK